MQRLFFLCYTEKYGKLRMGSMKHPRAGGKQNPKAEGRNPSQATARQESEELLDGRYPRSEDPGGTLPFLYLFFTKIVFSVGKGVGVAPSALTNHLVKWNMPSTITRMKIPRGVKNPCHP
jgi:hypothetical protein